ncbi:MAG: PKD domain-containing protein [Nanoarchaeota archaeon]|nr:PKD domain-containing protein [Nanoarchaeota archaeon]
MKREVKSLLYIFVFILTISIVSATFSFGKPNHSITKTYAPEDNIKGWINISLTDEPGSSLFETSSGNSISLLYLASTDPSFQYSCVPAGCSSGFSKEGSGTATKSLVLTEANEGFFGLEAVGNFNSASSFSLGVTSDAVESIAPQLSIDILNDGIIDWQSYLPSSNQRDKNYGCYVTANKAGQADITLTPYCEKINISISPNLTIGVEATKITGVTPVNFTLTISDGEGVYGACEAKATATGSISCSPNGGKLRITEEKPYDVCIRAKNSADQANYKINYEKTTPCGYVGEDNTWDFEIFSQPYKYAGLGSIVLNWSEIKKYNPSSEKVEILINNYILTEYGNNCAHGCIIPIKISGISQNAGLSNALLSYSAGISTSTDTIYDLTESDAKVTTSGFKKLSLDEANFLAPSEFGNYDFSLKLNTQKIFIEKISIERIPRINSVTPNIVMAAYPAFLSVDVKTFSRTINITKYKWTFDDGTETTIRNSIIHTFPNTGIYNLTVEVTDTRNATSTRKFNIMAEVPSRAIAFDLVDKLDSINKLNITLSKLSVFYRNSIKSILNLTEIEAQIDEIKARNETASSDQDYVDIMTDLMIINIPKNLSTSVKATAVPLFIKKDAINIDVVKDLSGETRTINEEEYTNAIIAWNNENIGMKVDFDEISANYDEEDIPLIRFFKVKITQKTTLDEDPYFIIPNFENLRFDKDYSEEVSGDSYYIKLTSGLSEISFSTTQEFSFQNLPAFVAPKISELSVTSTPTPTSGQENNRIIVAIILISSLVVLAGVSYLLMRKWYKNKYENYLFKNKNDLYNLVSYIQTAKRNNISESEIMSRLKKSKWKSEQIKYVMKKSK